MNNMKSPRWPDNKKAAFLLAFDDNADTHLDVVIPELEKREMIATFYVIPGSERFQSRQEEWRQASQSPFVALGNHTFSHRGATSVAELEDELERCSGVLQTLQPHSADLHWRAFGRPGGVPWTVSEDEVNEALEKFHLIRRPRFSSPAKPEESPQQISMEMAAIVDAILESGEMTQIGFHGVGGDWHSTPLECFIALLDKLEAHRDEIWITEPVALHQHTASQNAL